MNIQFFGAAQMVTGSKHLLTTPKGTKILLDCGLVQGHVEQRDDLNRHFGFKPSDIDYLILSHAHIDHSGLIPRLVKEGFNGLIFCTPATKSLCSIMLADSAHIQTADLKYVNKRRLKKNLEAIEPLYELEDVEKALSLMEELDYEEELKIDKEITLCFTDAGHLLGSAAVNLDITLPTSKKLKLTFSGDIGRYNDSIFRDPQPFRQCDYLICESTYGNKLHPMVADAEKELFEVITQTCVVNKGKLIIPAFSVDRTQEIIYILDKAVNEGRMPNIKVFVDSPLSVKATQIMRKHEECFRPEFIEYINKDEDPFGFQNLTYISEVEQSKALNSLEEPCIIISASGMAEAGRIKHHIMNAIENPKNTILLVGYCTPESLGGKLKSGEKMVRIFGEEFAVKAQVKSMDYYSAHADYDEIFNWLGCQKPAKIKEVFLVHGEIHTLDAFRNRFLEKGFEIVSIPYLAQKIELLP
ncbi:MAG: MBL fold metallo-hydrolase [Bacteroidetes bacterium B1(2017)]|nr:MAG: MBL fold metallo-hydrolase [Bacteroidetes bacterium B1(2017)]